MFVKYAFKCAALIFIFDAGASNASKPDMIADRTQLIRAVLSYNRRLTIVKTQLYTQRPSQIKYLSSPFTPFHARLCMTLDSFYIL